ncbi:ACT domain-containing protein [Alkalicoccus urumqiensis]|uniref:UPF0237 protein C6I21_03200 n=1 Tax=Alkalicoccus urumqiensis TaxID=1548213 RepID=A0A2P6ML10_ALKUR|nr:ACT domain-containing protein [Alkalicoccus urumqiensis]PRO66943.1 ACT domain-containing protein [Alkalicoccus urumqiensis]
MSRNRAVVSVVGKDKVGIISSVTTSLADQNVNILDISQTILQDFFTMMMLIELPEDRPQEDIEKALQQTAETIGVKIDIQREELFQSMHRI